MRRAFTVGSALLAIVLAACASAIGSGRSGLRGTVVRGPTTPVCRVGTPCAAPAADVEIVFRRGPRAVRTRTDARGRYRVALAPGSWLVRQATPGRRFGISPRRVRVVAGRFRVVRLSIDTGIR